MPSSKARHEFETRSLPRLLAATGRGFTFYVADPLSSIHEFTPISCSVTRFVTIRVIRVLNPRHADHEKRGSSNWNHWWQRFVPDGGITRHDCTQDRYTVWVAIGCSDWGKITRAAGLLLAAARSRSSDSAARNKLSGQHLRASLAQRSLDHLSGGSRQFAGKIRAARCGVTLTVL